MKCGASEVAFQTSFISASLNMLDDLVKLQQGTIKVADKFADKHYLLKKTKVCQVCPLASICFLQAFFSKLLPQQRLNWFAFDLLTKQNQAENSTDASFYQSVLLRLLLTTRQ